MDDPKNKIYKDGGHILLAEINGEIVGTCALIKMEEGKYELAKMAVSPNHQKMGIGYGLGIATIEKAREMGAHTVYLETNSKLAPALQLYKKMGFEDVDWKETPYSRCNTQMELKL